MKAITRSTFRPVTWDHTSLTMPAARCPGEWQRRLELIFVFDHQDVREITLAAFTDTSTSWAAGPGDGISILEKVRRSNCVQTSAFNSLTQQWVAF